MVIYCADLYCDACGDLLVQDSSLGADTGDSDDYPQWVMDGRGESDSPNHCASGANCADAIDLGEYGAPGERIGAHLSETLTEDGRAYLFSMVRESDGSAYQKALHAYWGEVYADEIQRASEDSAEASGHEAGVAAGSWTIDGNTTAETARAILQGIEDGDPAIVDLLPCSPLSGEWADAPLPRDVLADVGMTEDSDGADDVLRAYEDGFSRGVEDEVTRSARVILRGENDV